MDIIAEITKHKNRLLNLLDPYYQPNMVLLDHRELTATATVIQVLVPEGYKDLLLKCYLRTDLAGTTDAIRVAFNLDNTNVYDSMRVAVAHSAALATAESLASNGLRLAAVNGATSPANYFTPLEIHIPEYSGSNNKLVHANGNIINTTTTGAVFYQYSSGVWKNTSAITVIRVFPITGTNFVAGCKLSLYGLR